MKLRNRLKKTILRSIRLAAMSGTLTLFSAAAFAAVANDALPTNPQFMANIEKITAANGVMTVDQNKTHAAINWGTFNVGANATVNFNYHGKQEGAYNILNFSVNNGMASEIYGRLKAGAEANVWLVNPNGVVIGKGAQIDVGHMHLVTHNLANSDLTDFADGNTNVTGMGTHTAAELMSMGNMYVNSISFDGNRVVIDADKLYTYAGDKVELGKTGALGKADDLVHDFTAAERDAIIAAGKATSKTDEAIQADIEAAIADKTTVTPVYLGEGADNNTNDFASAAAIAGGNTWTGDALNNNNYLTISQHAKEVVVGYTVYDEKGTGANGTVGTYENSTNWRALYTTLADANGTPKADRERVGFAWVENSTQLEKIGEGVKSLGRDFALKDGIAAVNTKEMNPVKDGGGNIINYAGFQPIGADPTNESSAHKTPFTGKFDGLNYDIYGLTINRPDEDDIGLFGHVGDGAVIRNVNLVSGAIVGENRVGGVAGHVTGNVIIENVKNSARVLGINDVGGIVGKAEGTSASAPVKIINAENVALVRGNTNVGGIAGSIDNTEITGETFNTGAVKGIVDYQLADTAYASKSAAQLTEAVYNTIPLPTTNVGTPKVGDLFTFQTHNGVKPENFTCTVTAVSGDVTNGEMATGARVTGTVVSAYYDLTDRTPDRGGQTVTLEKQSDGRYSIIWNNGTWYNKDKDILKYVSPAVGTQSNNVGGIAGQATNSTIGNASGFTIYNDVEVKAGYNVGGIVGKLTSSEINNAANKGDITAVGSTIGKYYFLTSSSGDTRITGNGTSNGTASIGYIDVAVANVGGIAGIVNGSSTVQSKLDTVSNTGDVTSVYVKNTDVGYAAQTGKKTVGDVDNTRSGIDYYFYKAGNVGGIVGASLGGEYDSNGVVSYANEAGVTINNAKNIENNVAGAHNVGGIVGDMLNTVITDSVNEGGDISATGGRKVSSGGADIGFAKENVRSNETNSSNPRYFVGNIGGIVGHMSGLQSAVDNVRNRGYVHTELADDSTGKNYTEGYVIDIHKATNVGGIVGKLDNRYDNSGSIANINDVLNNIDNTAFYITKDAEGNIVKAVFGVASGSDQAYAEKNAWGYLDSSNVWHKSDVIGYGRMVNGQVVQVDAAIKNAANTGKVAGFSGIGGVVGQVFYGEIEKSYNMGNITTSFASQASGQMDQANMGGILGDTPARAGAFVRMYDVYNEGVIGDDTFTYFGRHVGGIVGRLIGDIEKSYNIGDIYAGSDSIGGIAGYSQGIRSANHITNSFNVGNITDYSYSSSGSRVGGIVGATDVGTTYLSDVYNLGALRSYKVGSGANKVAGIAAERTGGSLIIDRAYTTGELFAGVKSGDVFVKDTAEVVYGIAHATNGNINTFFIRPENPEAYNTVKLDSVPNVTAIDFDKRFDINQWKQTYLKLAGEQYASTDPSSFATSGNWRMYCYDQVTGNTLKYSATGRTEGEVTYHYYLGTASSINDAALTDLVADDNVRATLPVLNAYIPNISNYLGDTTNKPSGMQYVQYGNEYNPLMTFVHMNDDGANLNVDYTKANIVGRGGLAVENGGLTINNVNSSQYFSGTFMAGNGDLNINAVSGTLNLASDSKFYGANVNIINSDHDVNILGSIEALGQESNANVTTSGNVTIKGENVEVYGPITSGSYYADSATPGVEKTGHLTTIDGISKTGKGLTYSADDVKDPKKQLASKATAYSESIKNDYLGNITVSTDLNDDGIITAGGDVNLRLGNTHAGKISTDGNLAVVGKNIYIDSDIKIGVNAKNDIVLKGDDIVLDFSNMGATFKPAPGESAPSQAEMLHAFANNFSGSKGSISFQKTDGSATEGKLLLDYFNANNELQLDKYNQGGVPLSSKLPTMNVSNGSEENVAAKLAYVWIANDEQLKNIQAAGAPALSINYALKNSIDASEVTDFVSIGSGSTTGYTGTFDGRGNNLNSLTPASKDVTGVASNGLFSIIGEGGAVKNLNINASRLTGETSRVGLVAGTNKGTIDNVNTYGNTVKDANAGSDPKFIGGLVGFNDVTGVITNSKTEDIVFSESSNVQVDVGGVAGMNAGIIHNVTGKSDVSVSEGGATSLGGVVGVNAGLIKDAVTTGVTAGLYERHGEHEGEVIGAENVGGIAGENRTKYLTSAGVQDATNTFYIKENADGTYSYSANAEITGAKEYTNGTITEAYNDSKVKGWSNTGGIVGRNFGETDTTTHGGLSMDSAANVQYVANAADVIGGENVGGLIGTNNANVKGVNSALVVTDMEGNKYTLNADGTVASAVNKNNVAIALADITDAKKAELKSFKDIYLDGTEHEISQVIYGRNSGKITAKYGMVQGTAISKGTNVGGLMGVSDIKANVEGLLNGKASSVYGATNVGGLIGENRGVLQKSTNLMQNNEIAGAWQVGGIVGNNTGVIVGLENTNKFNITTNTDYVSATTGQLNAAGIAAVTAIGVTSPVYASYFGGVVGHNAAGGTVGDVINFADVTINRPAHYVGGVIGRNDGTIAAEGAAIANPAGGGNLSISPKGYLRNNGEVGVMTGTNDIIEGGKYIGGVIGENNSAINHVDITNNIGGSVTGDQYVGGIIGKNTAVVEGGRDAGNNYYKYDVYNNGKVVGTENVGGLVGENAAGGSLVLAYNTGVVTGENNVGGIVGTNAGTVDQVFNSTAPYDKAGVAITDAGVTGTTNVGGLVGVNISTGTITNAYNDGKATGATEASTGAVVGSNAGTLAKSWANVVMDGANNVTIRLVGANSGTLTNNYSVSEADSNVAGQIIKLSVEDMVKEAKFDQLANTEWAFYNNAATPLLKNFLTKAYFVPNGTFGDTFVYNGKEQGAGIKIENGHVNVYKVVDGVMTDTKVGEIFAADASGDHSLADYILTSNKNALNFKNEDAQLIVGKADGVDANRYNMLYSHQINTQYNNNVKNKDGVVERVVNPNMLGYEFEQAELNDTSYDPTAPVYDPSKPNYDPADPNSNPKGLDKENPGHIPTPDKFTPEGKAPTYDINKAIITASGNDVTRTYGNIALNGDSYAVTINPGVITEKDKTELKNILGENYLDKLFTTATPDLNTEAGRQQDAGLTGAATGAVTKNANVKDDGVEDYKWNGSYALKSDYATGLTPEQKTALDKVLYNYALKDDDAYKKAYEEVKMGTGAAEGNSYVTKAELNITLGNFSVVYGEAESTITGLNTITYDSTADSSKNIVNGLTNGDSDISDVYATITWNNGAYTGTKTNNVKRDSSGNILGYDLDWTTTPGTNNGNYNVTFNQGSVAVTPRTLTVTGNDVTRTYGGVAGADNIANTAAGYGVAVGNWAYGEDFSANIGWDRTSDGGIDTSTLGNHGDVSKRVTNKVNTSTDSIVDYTWGADLSLKDGDNYRVEGLQNYTFASGDTATTGGKSFVTPVTTALTVGDISMIYGAKEGTAAGPAKENEFYKVNADGKTVYEDNVRAAYTIKNDFLVNGDSLEDVLSVDKNAFVNKGFSTTDQYDSAYKTNDVNADSATKYDLTLTGGVSAVTKNNAVSGTGYNLTDVNKGKVTVEYAIISTDGSGDAVYRYYGEEQMYKREGGNLVEISAYPATTDTITGFVYGEGEEASGVSGYTYKKNLITAHSGTVTDNALATDADKAINPNKVTKDVAAYDWSGGTLTVVENTMTSTGALKNYRFWDYTNHTTTTEASNTTIGGASYVLPQTITVNLDKQSVVYGTAMDAAKTAYADGSIVTAATGTAYKSHAAIVDSDGNLIANGDSVTGINIKNILNGITAAEIKYNQGDNKAYLENAHTNNVKAGGYDNSVGLQAANDKLQNNDVEFIPNTGSISYVSLKGNRNYALNIVNGNVEVTPKELTVGSISGEIVYGATGGASAITGVTNAVITGGSSANVGVYGEALGITQGAVNIVETGVYKTNIAAGKNTADVLRDGSGNIISYGDSIDANITIANGNYVLNTNKAVGDLKVTPADITINLNTFKVLYGDTKANNTLNVAADGTYSRTTTVISDAEQDLSNNVGLTNNDNISDVINISSFVNEAFDSYDHTNNVQNGYKLSVNADATNLRSDKSRTGNTLTGTSASGNYNVTVIDGSVDVIAKKVVIVNNGDPTPNPSTDPDRVYVKAEDVKRVYGDTDLTNTSGKYQVSVDNLTSWDAANKVVDIAKADVTADGGVKTSGSVTVETATETSNAADAYTWNTNILDTLGSNYVLDDTSKVVTGKSVVEKATIVYKLSDHTNANSNAIAYGTVNHKDYIDYSGAIVDASGTRADGKSYATTYTSTANKLAAQDAGKTLDDLFSYTDANTGYDSSEVGKNGTGKDVTYDGTNKNFYAHNAIDFKGSGTAEYIGDDANTADHNNIGKTYVKGTSFDGNYNVIVVSGDVEFNKKTLDASVNVKGDDVTRVYGNRTPNEYTANVTSGLVSWDSTKDKTVTISGVADGAIATGTAAVPTKTANKGDYSWTGTGTLNGALSNNYDLVNTVTAGSAVTPANLTVYLNDFAITYGDVDKTKVITNTTGTITSDAQIGAAEKEFKYSTVDGEKLVNGDTSTALVINKVVNGAYADATHTKDVGNDYTLDINRADSSATSGTKVVGGELYTADENYKLNIVAGKVDVLQKHITLKADDVTMQYGSVEDDGVAGDTLKLNQAGIATNDISSLYKLVATDGNQVVNGDDLSSIVNVDASYFLNTGFDKANSNKTHNVGVINNGLEVVGSVVSTNGNYVIDSVANGNVTITHALLTAAGGDVYRYYGDTANMYTVNAGKTELTKTDAYAISTDNVQGIVYGENSVKDLLTVTADSDTKDYSLNNLYAASSTGTANVGEHDWTNGNVAYKAEFATNDVAKNYRLWNAGYNDNKGAVVAINEADKANIVVTNTEVGKVTEGASISGKAYVLPVLYTNQVAVTTPSIEYGSVQGYERPTYESLGAGAVAGAKVVSNKITLGAGEIKAGNLGEYTGTASTQATTNKGDVTTALEANGFDNGALVEVSDEWRTNNVKREGGVIAGYDVTINEAGLQTYTDALGRTYKAVNGNANYIVVVDKAQQKVTPKTVTIDGLTGHIMYGKQDGNDLLLDNVAGGYVNGLVYGDSLSYNIDNANAVVKTGTTAYNTNKGTRDTADYGTYADSMKVTGVAELTGDATTVGNYVLNTDISGTIKVNSANLVINLNDFAIVYGDVDKSKKITATSTANPFNAGVTIAAAEKQIKESGLVNGDSASGVAVTGVTNGAYVSDTKTANAGLDYSLKATSMSGTVSDTTGTYTSKRNYKIVAVNDGKVDVVPKKLTVTTNTVTRDYGTDTVGDGKDAYVGIAAEQFVNGDNAKADALKGNVGWTRTSDGAITGNTTGKITYDVNRIGVADEGGYDWTGTLNLTGEDLKNYTFGEEGAARVESLNVTNKSEVTPYHINIKAGDITMIYGAYENDQTGLGLTTNSNYANAGQTVYDNWVEKAYTIVAADGSAKYNGDDLASVITLKSGTTFKNEGFVDGKTIDVNTDKAYADKADLKLVKGSAAATASDFNVNKNYVIDGIGTGKTTVEYALLEAKGDDVYRYYGEAQMYKKVDGSLQAVSAHPVATNEVTGWAYDEGTAAMKALLTTTPGTAADGAVDGLAAGKVTNNVKAEGYTWSNGTLTAAAGAMTSTGDLKNYRFWKNNAVATEGGVMGGASYVLPQEITITLNSQIGANAVEYGSTMAEAMNGYAGLASVAGSYRGNTTGNMVEGNVLKANGDNINVANVLAGKYEYAVGADKAYTAADKTNNVYNADGTKAVYADSIVLNGSAFESSNKGVTFDPAGNTSYKVLVGDTNGNYVVKVVNGSVELTPRALTVEKIDGTVVYGDQKGTGIVTTAPEFKENRVVAGDTVNLIKGEVVAADGLYTKTGDEVRTGNAGEYTDKLTTGVSIDNKNYILVDNTTDRNAITNVVGDLKITPADLVVTLNNFKVMYGDQYSSSLETVNTAGEWVRSGTTVVAAEVATTNWQGLTNGDDSKTGNDKDNIFKLNSANDLAFKNYTVNSTTVKGTKEAGTYNLFAGSTNVQNDAKLDYAHGTVAAGLSNDGNYNVTIQKGSVEVLAKPVEVVDPNAPTPTPDPNGIKVYIKAEEVQRTYGDTTITNNADNKYHYTVTGLAAWETASGIIEPSRVGVANDGGLSDKSGETRTNNADTYTWNGTLGSSDIAGLGSNYLVGGVAGGTTATITGTSVVNKAVLNVAGSNVVRDYGNATAYVADSTGAKTTTLAAADNHYGAAITGWAYGEGASLESKVGWSDLTDAGVDTSSYSTNKSERVTNHVNKMGAADGVDYKWSANLNLSAEDLKNYTFAGNSNTAAVSGDSYVLPVDLNVKLNSFDIVYGAKLGDADKAAVDHDLYTNVYTDNVASLYKVDASTQFANGDTLEEVIASFTRNKDAGFSNDTYTDTNGNTYKKTLDVTTVLGTDNQYSGAVTLTSSASKDYNVQVGTGDVTVKHAIIKATGGGDIYRYYGEVKKMYKLNDSGNLEEATAYPTIENGVAGLVYGQTTDKVHITANNTDHFDKGLVSATKTNNVGAHEWGGGTVTVDGGETTFTDDVVLKNYRFWDNVTEQATTSTEHVGLGGASYVLPQEITITLKNQSNVEYGSTMVEAMNGYTGIASVTGSYRGNTTGNMVEGTTLKANGDNINLADVLKNQYTYAIGSDKAYVDVDKTNNVYVTGTTNKAVYADSIVLNDAALVDKTNTFEPVAANSSYKSLASDTTGNYIVKVVNGSVDLTPRQLTVDKINGTVVYGDQKGTGIETGTPGFTPEGNRVITGDIVNIIKGATTPDSSVYDKSSGTPHTGDVGTHADTLTTEVSVDNPNYVIVNNNVNGDLTITPAELIINVGDASTIYGQAFDASKYDMSFGSKIDGGNLTNGDDITVIKNAILNKSDFVNHHDYLNHHAGEDGTTDDAGIYANGLTLKDAANISLKNYTIKEINNGTVTIEKAQLTINLNDHNVIYGTPEAWISNSYGVKDNGVSGVAAQDKVTLNANGTVTITSNKGAAETIGYDFNNTGYTDGKTNPVGNGYKLQATNATIANVNNDNPNAVTGNITNYNVVINAGDVEIKERPVTVIDPNGTVPVVPSVPGPGTIITNDPYDPLHPEKYNPADPTDPRNQLILQTNTVERTYGDVDHMYDGSKNPTDYKVDVIYGLPEGMTAPTVTVDPVKDDTKVKSDHETYGVEGTGSWTGLLSGLNSNFGLPTDGKVTGGSIVNKAVLTVTLNDVIMAYGSTEGDASATSVLDKAGVATTNIANQYGYTVSGAVNGDANDNSFVKVNSYDNQGFNASGMTKDVVYGADDQPVKGYVIGASAISNNANYDIVVVEGGVTVTPAILTANGQTVYRTYGDTQMYSSSQYNPDGTLKADRNADKIDTYTHGEITGFLNGDEGLLSHIKVDDTGKVKDEALVNVSTTNDANASGHHYEWKEGSLSFNTHDDARLNNYRFYDEDEQGATANKYLTNTAFEGKSYIERAQLTITLNDHTIKFGTPETAVSGDYSVESVTGVVVQDKGYVVNADGSVTVKSAKDVDDKIIFGYNNTGYDNGVTKEIGDGYQLEAVNAPKFIGNYDLTFVPGNVEIVPSPFNPSTDIPEDMFPWLHRTNTDHGFSWGKQEHWRERKAEVNYVHGGADFFYDLAERMEIDKQKQITIGDANFEHIEVDAQNHVYIVEEHENVAEKIAAAEAADDEALKN